MNYGFAVTQDDVWNVLNQLRKKHKSLKQFFSEDLDELSETLFDELDLDEACEAALGDDMDEQTSSMYENLEQQIRNYPMIKAHLEKEELSNVTHSAPKSPMKRL